MVAKKHSKRKSRGQGRLDRKEIKHRLKEVPLCILEPGAPEGKPSSGFSEVVHKYQFKNVFQETSRWDFAHEALEKLREKAEQD